MTTGKMFIKLITEIAEESHSISVGKGWWDDFMNGAATPEDHEYRLATLVPVKVLLIGTEIAEAAEDLRNGKLTTTIGEKGKPEGFPSEVADIVIRAQDFLMAIVGIRQISKDPMVKQISMVAPHEIHSDPQGIALAMSRENGLSYMLSIASSINMIDIDNGAEGFDYFNSVAEALQYLIYYCIGYSVTHEIDLIGEIKRKQEFNKTRPHRHGGKAF